MTRLFDFIAFPLFSFYKSFKGYKYDMWVKLAIRCILLHGRQMVEDYEFFLMESLDCLVHVIY